MHVYENEARFFIMTNRVNALPSPILIAYILRSTLT